MESFSQLQLSSRGPLECALHGSALLNHAVFNKGSAFSPEERRDFRLGGLLPARQQTLAQQVERAYQQYSTRPNDLAKNTFLTSVRDQNRVLFFRLAQDHLKEMFSVLYTPTEGDAIQNYSRLFRRPDGCFLNIHDTEHIFRDLAQWGRAEDIDYIVVTDGEEILGIGDQGVGGILISLAKLILTTLCAGIHPSRTLAVVLDCGTDNELLLSDPLYLGLREKRVRGTKYDQMVDMFVRSARHLFPRAYIHFEDFGLSNARRILDTYRPQMPCFNDDVQGTGCVTLAAILSGFRVGNMDLADLRMIVFGAGTAGVGIADQVRDAVAAETGVSKQKAAQHIWLVDKPGLLLDGMDVSAAQAVFAKNPQTWQGRPTDLLGVVEAVRPNVLVGTSTVPGAFSRPIVEAMAAHVARPVILPLSNPTRLHEAVPADLLTWTGGRALVATGSPFAPVRGPWGPDGAEVEFAIAECNNSVVFPGIGLGSILCRASRVTDGMLVAAVEAVAEMSPVLTNPTAPLLPGVEAVRDVSVAIARRVVRAAASEGVATEPNLPLEGGDALLEAWIREQMWQAVYRPLKYVPAEQASRHAMGLRRQGTPQGRRDSWT